MATYSELQTRIQRRVIDLPTAVTDEVPTLINEAIKEIETDHNFKVMEAISGPHYTNVDTNTLTAIPSDFKEYRANPYYVENAGHVRDISVVANQNGIYDFLETDDTGYPIMLFDTVPSDEDGTRAWQIYPKADGNSDYDDGEYKIYVPYWKYLTDLSDDTDTNWFTVNGEKWIIYRATAEAFALDWDLEHETEWLQKAATEYKKLINRDKRFRVSTIKTIVPLWQGVNQPNVRL